jgi:hypothetical protein
MTELERELKMKELLMAYEPEELKGLRADCLEIQDTYDLGKCAERLRQMADHELEAHQCAGAFLYIAAVAKRLNWYHSQVLKLQQEEQRAQVIH